MRSSRSHGNNVYERNKESPFFVNVEHPSHHNYIEGYDERVDEDRYEVNVQDEGEGGARLNIEECEYTLITTYPFKISKNLPWENQIQELTLQRCTSLSAKLKGDFEQLDLLTERRELQIVLHSLGAFIDVYNNIRPTTDNFIDLMRQRKKAVMSPNKWLEIQKKVSKDQARSLFNFKEGSKQ